MIKQSFYRRVVGSKQVHRRFTLKAIASIFTVGAWLSMGVPVSVAQGSGDIAKIASYTGSDRQQLLEAGAKKEGELLVYTVMPVDDMAALSAAFEKKYGIKVKVWRAAGDKVVQRALAEHRAGHFSVDIIETTGLEQESLHREKILQAVKSPYQADLIPAATINADWTASRLNVFAIAYNTNVVKKGDLPKTYDDLLDPKWKGKIGVESGDLDWFATLMGMMGEKKGVQLFRDIVAKNGVSARKGHSLLANLVASGEVPIALTVYNYKAEQLKNKGAPIEWFTINPTVAIASGVSMAKGAPHPHAAVLFYDFLLSDGQQIVADRQVVPTSAKIKSKLNEMPLKLIDLKVVLDENKKWTDLYEEIFVRQEK